jgi:hypothetical protein
MPFDHFSCIAGFYYRARPFILRERLRECLSLSSSSLCLDAGGGSGLLDGRYFFLTISAIDSF